MTDEKSVVVQIGAVLQSSFRTAFRDANREATTLNRVLGQLGARRSNAGLSGVRDQAAGASPEAIGRAAAEHIHEADRMAAADLRSATADWLG